MPYAESMLSEFIDRRLRQAKYKILRDGTYFGEVPGLRGVWAASDNLEDCRAQLREVIEDWLFLKVRDREPVPGLRIKSDRRELVKSA